MSISFVCRECGKHYSIRDEFAGKRAKCSQCGVAVSIPTKDAARPARRMTPEAEIPTASANRMPLLIGAASVGGILFFVVTYFVIHAIVFAGSNRRDATVGGAGGGDGAGPAVAAAATESRPAAYPPRPTAMRKANIEMYGVDLVGTGPVFPMRLLVYVPAGQHALHSLPCVVIAPAGSPLFYGMGLGAGDVPEHVPYVRAGFAVCAYELSGRAPGDALLTFGEAIGPAKAFAAAGGGVANGKAAIDYVLSQLPEVDPQRIYAAGHSSAADVALDLAAEDPRVRGVAAYAPATDIDARFGDKMSILDQVIPGEAAFLSRLEPIHRVNDFCCPILVFHADDDTNVPTSDNQEFVDAMQRSGKTITFKRVTGGGHYESMIHEGIPAGIAFLESLGARPLPGIAE